MAVHNNTIAHNGKSLLHFLWASSIAVAFCFSVVAQYYYLYGVGASNLHRPYRHPPSLVTLNMLLPY